MAASEAEVFRRRGKMTHEMHAMGLVGFHEHDRRIGDEHAAVFNMACRAQERKERLAKAAKLPPSAAARWNPGDAERKAQLLRRARSLGLSDPQPSDNAIGPPAATTSSNPASAGDSNSAAKGAEGVPTCGRWEIRFNRLQGQLGVWEGGRHATKPRPCAASSGPENQEGRSSASAESVEPSDSDKFQKYRMKGSTKRRDEPAHPREIPYLEFTPVPQWLLKPSSWYVPDGDESIEHRESSSPAGTRDPRGNAYTGSYSEDEDGAVGCDGDTSWGGVAAALARYRKPAVSNLHFGPTSLHFSEPPSAVAVAVDNTFPTLGL